MTNLQNLKGFRDFLPQQARKRQYVIGILKSVFESYGFEPLETPSLEYEEILTGKYGDEGEKLMYKFEDLGKRKVALRYDQTVPLARVVSQYQNELPFPFKRYQIQNVWRAENTQRGRFREFLQCDIDTVGSKSITADAEIIAIVSKVFAKLKFLNYKISLNDRKIFKDIPTKAIIIIDKLKKIGLKAVREELSINGMDPEIINKIMDSEKSDNLKQIIESACNLGVKNENITFDPTLARGLDYYTELIIEVEIIGYDAGSVGGGGRYDNLIGIFVNRQIPAVGFAFGFDRVMEAMEQLNLFPAELSMTKVLVTVFSPDLLNKSSEISSLLRISNINTEIYLDENISIEKQLKYADKKKIPFVIIMGPEELEKHVVQLKDMRTRSQEEININDLVNLLK